MRNKALLACAVLMLALAASAVAADVTGKWVAERQGPQGTTQTTFNFKVTGTTLTGTMSGRTGDTEITEGKVNGDEISFAVIRKFGENEMKMVYKGKVSGDEIKITMEMPAGGFGGGMGAPPAGAGGQGGPGAGPGGGQGGPRGAMEMIAKRVK